MHAVVRSMSPADMLSFVCMLSISWSKVIRRLKKHCADYALSLKQTEHEMDELKKAGRGPRVR